MATCLKWFLDTTNDGLVISEQSSTPFTPSKFFQGDSIPMEIVLLEVNPVGGLRAPYSRIIDANLTVSVGLVTPGAISAQTYTRVDLAFDGINKWVGTLLMTDARINTLLGSAASASCYLEIEISTASGVIATELQQVVTVLADGLKTGVPVTTPGETYVTGAQFRNEAAKKVGDPGDSITLVSADGLKGVNLRVNKDPVTGEYTLKESWVDLS